MDPSPADRRDWNHPFPTTAPAIPHSVRPTAEIPGADLRRPNSTQRDESSVFFRMILSSVLHDKKLKIPGKLSKKIMNEFPAVASLTTPDGCVLSVGLRMIDGKIWFVDGLNDFFRHHSIRPGYLLLFMYEGELNFSVQIFNVAASEIKYRCNAVGSFEGTNRGNDRAEMLSSFPTPWQPPRLNPAKSHFDFGLEENVSKNSDKLQAKYVQYAEWNFNGSEATKTSKPSGGNLVEVSEGLHGNGTRNVGIQCDFSELVTSAYKIRMNTLNERPEKPRKRKKGKASTEVESSSKQGREVKIPENEAALLRKWRVITPEEKERVLSVAKMFQSENPFCRVILRRSYVYKGIGLHMPASFAEKYLTGVSGFVMLQVSNGEKWPVRCLWRGGSAKLSKGWPEFVSGNKLEEGDACVFELMNTGADVVLRVTIIRLAEVSAAAGPVNHLLLQPPPPNQQLISRR